MPRARLEAGLVIFGASVSLAMCVCARSMCLDRRWIVSYEALLYVRETLHKVRKHGNRRSNKNHAYSSRTQLHVTYGKVYGSLEDSVVQMTTAWLGYRLEGSS